MAALPSPAMAMSVADWRGHGWRLVPDAREDARGQREEPITLQWLGPPSTLAAALAPLGWRRPPAWWSEATLLWLLPSTPVGELPVLPKFDQGEAPGLTLVKPLGPRERLVLRLWPGLRLEVARLSVAHTLLVGAVTLERMASDGGLIAHVRTLHAFAEPLAALDRDLARAKVTLRTVQRPGLPLLLASPAE
jgi:undecaprenyl-diphosphatase